jgi:tetratricopeptide (TPR) repeat protein
MKIRSLAMPALVLASLAFTGCAGPVEHWIVDTRVHQGDDALARGNVSDAELSYRLALKVDPSDARAQQGFVSAAAALAQVQFEKGDFDSAAQTIDDASIYDPQSVRLSALHTAIENAKLKREIVISNYPTYELAGQQLQKAYLELNDSNKIVLKSLKRFDYTYDTTDLTKAIDATYDLQQDVGRDLNRLVAYRQLVQAGASTKGEPVATGGSLLPLP